MSTASKQWVQIIRECQSSGLSNKEYCRQHGISEKSYYHWLRKLRNAATEGILQIVEMEATAAMEDKEYIRFRGVKLALPAGTDVEAIDVSPLACSVIENQKGCFQGWRTCRVVHARFIDQHRPVSLYPYGTELILYDTLPP